MNQCSIKDVCVCVCVCLCVCELESILRIKLVYKLDCSKTNAEMDCS